MSSPASTSPAATVFPITRLGTTLNYFLAILLSTALVTALVFVIYVISPRPALLLVPPICFLIILETTLTTRWLAADEQRQVNRFLYRGAELVFIFAALRLLTWLLDGRLPDFVTLRQYILAPLSFFDSRYVGFLFFAIIAWDRAATFAAILTRLSLTGEEMAFYALPAYRRSLRADDRPFDARRPEHFTSLINNWVLGGIVLAFCAAVTTFQLPAADSANVFQLRNLSRIGLRPEMLVLLLTYFLGGLWLIGRMRLVTMRARWIIDGIQVQPGVQRTWNRASLLLILLIALVAAFLPIGSSFAFARIIGAVAGFLLLLVNLFFILLTLFIYLFLVLLGRPTEDTQPLEQLERLAPTPVPQPTEPPNETIAFIFGSLFWVLVVAVAVVAILYFLHGRGYRLEVGQWRGWWGRLVGWLRGLWRGTAGRVAGLGAALANRRGAVEEPAGSPWGFIRLNALSAREQIRYFYLSTVRRASERGVPRDRSETPSEFAADLKENWPEAEGDIEALTDAFLHARYSRQEIEKEDVSPVKQTWKRVKSSLRRRHRR